MDAIIKLVNLKKSFGTHWVTKGVNLDIPKGKMTVIIGRSGEGKSVLLKQIIGLIEPTEGTIFFNGVNITVLTEKEREEHFKHCGYVFQFAALLDSLNTLENIGITLLENGQSLKEVLPVVKEKLALVNLPEDTLINSHQNFPVVCANVLALHARSSRTPMLFSMMSQQQDLILSQHASSMNLCTKCSKSLILRLSLFRMI